MPDRYFPGEGRARVAQRIRDARLHPMDEKIAEMRLLQDMSYIDIGAAVPCDRRTASRRFNRILDRL